jgi:hypothetical protein
MENVKIGLAPTSVSAWDEEDEASAVFGEELQSADDAQAKAMLDQLALELPAALDWKELVRYAQQHQALGGLKIPPDSKNYSFYVIEAPVTIILPHDQKLVRLRLVLDLQGDSGSTGQVLAYDVFPPSQLEVKQLATGEVNLDVSKALQFILTSVGAAKAAPATEALGLKLNLPFKWTTTSVKLQASARMSTRVQWYVTDASIQSGFAPCAILRAPRGTIVTVAATITGELRSRGPSGWFKAQFVSPQPRVYVLK